ncbi:MAG: hypothetical protein ACE5F1_19385, partial [Planctomycetota bacterium]
LKRYRWVFAFLVALLGMAAIPAVAGAGVAPPQEPKIGGENYTPPFHTNIPLLNWRGGETRFERCFVTTDSFERDIASFRDDNGRDPVLHANFVVENWTGDGLVPPQTSQGTSTWKLRIAHDGNGVAFRLACFSADFVSAKAGMAEIKAVFTGADKEWFRLHFKGIWVGFFHKETGITLAESKYMGIWMNIMDVRLENEPAKAPNPTPGDKGSPAQDTSLPGKSGFDFRATARGWFPLGDKKGDLSASVILPDDYAALAGEFAIDNRNPFTDTPGSAPLAWDQDGAPLALTPPGPFDQLLFWTWQPDGFIDASDAAMPALRLDPMILPNGTNKTKNGIDGAGVLTELDKRDVFPKDETTGLWPASFYEARIPSTASGEISSGTTGVPNPQGFVGYLPLNKGGDGSYKFWEFAAVQETGGGNNLCAQYLNPHTGQAAANYPLPFGVQKAALYTDENGRAWFHWNPGFGFYFDNIPDVVPVDGNGACDLQGKPILGYSDIQVQAKYPYQTVFGEPDYKSDIVQKTIYNGFNKAVYFEPKQVQAGSLGWFVTAWATEPDGQPLGSSYYGPDKEIACFSTPDAVINVPAPQDILSPDKVLSVFGLNPADWTCVFTHDNVNASLATVGVTTTGGPATVLVWFMKEQIKRMITVGAPSGGVAPPPKDSGKPVTNPKGPGTSTPTTAQIAAAGIAVPETTQRLVAVTKAKFKKLRKKVRIHGRTVKRVKRGIVIAKVQSPTRKARVKVQLMGFRHGSLVVLSSFKKTMKANTRSGVRLKVVKNARIAKKVTAVRITPLKAVGRPVA